MPLHEKCTPTISHTQNSESLKTSTVINSGSWQQQHGSGETAAARAAQVVAFVDTTDDSGQTALGAAGAAPLPQGGAMIGGGMAAGRGAVASCAALQHQMHHFSAQQQARAHDAADTLDGIGFALMAYPPEAPTPG